MFMDISKTLPGIFNLDIKMDLSNYVVFGAILYIRTVFCEYCTSYTDSQNVSHPGFNCPPALRLVGKSDFYCCLNDTNGRHYCCNDRTKSLFHSDRTYGQEAFIMYWPFLALGGLITGFVVIIPYTMPRNAEVKHDSPMD